MSGATMWADSNAMRWTMESSQMTRLDQVTISQIIGGCS